MKTLFITGTDTSVGKTYVTARLAYTLRTAGLRVGAYKPACSGAVRGNNGGWIWEDAETLAAAITPGFPIDWVCPQRFVAPLAPPFAAMAEGRRADSTLLRTGMNVWQGQVDVLLVEGAGGWLSPLCDDGTNGDLAQDLGVPVLIVAANRLGVINHTLLTVQAVRSRGLSLVGVLLNDCSQTADDLSRESNLAGLQQFADVPIWGPVPYVPPSTTLAGRFDWTKLAQQLNLLKS